MDLLNIQTIEELKKSHAGWIEEALSSNGHVREKRGVKSPISSLPFKISIVFFCISGVIAEDN
jgi:hypothetical protein